MENLKWKSVFLRGTFVFFVNSGSNFEGPIRKGFRPIIWYGDDKNSATSCSFVEDIEIFKGETKQVDIFILNELQLNTKILFGLLLNVGSTKHKIGEFKVLEHLGLWNNEIVP